MPAPATWTEEAALPDWLAAAEPEAEESLPLPLLPEPPLPEPLLPEPPLPLPPLPDPEPLDPAEPEPEGTEPVVTLASVGTAPPPRTTVVLEPTETWKEVREPLAL